MVWPLTYISALILSLAIYMGLRRLLRNSRFIVRIGEYSLLIFLLNGILREQFIDYATTPSSALLFGCVSAAVTFAVAAVIQEFLMPAAIAE